MKILHNRLCSSIGTIVTGFMKATITSTSVEHMQFYAHTNGMIGHLFIFKKLTTKENRLKITTPQKYLVSCLLKENVKLLYNTMFRETTSLECCGKIFFVKMKLGTDFNISFVKVPIEALVHPLCVIPDSGGDSKIYLLFYQNVIGADSLVKELSSLPIFKYCVCV